MMHVTSFLQPRRAQLKKKALLPNKIKGNLKKQR
jgi:hypothetical protein